MAMMVRPERGEGGRSALGPSAHLSRRVFLPVGDGVAWQRDGQHHALCAREEKARE
jgi:hypothetical protein